MLDAIEKAQRSYKVAKRNGVPDDRIIIDMMRDVGEGYKKGTGAYKTGLNKVQIIFDEYGQVISAYPLYN